MFPGVRKDCFRKEIMLKAHISEECHRVRPRYIEKRDRGEASAWQLPPRGTEKQEKRRLAERSKGLSGCVREAGAEGCRHGDTEQGLGGVVATPAQRSIRSAWL